MTTLELAAKAIASIGLSATWHISASSEGCRIAISGLPVAMAFQETQHEFISVDGAYDLWECIVTAADAYELACYPERGRIWREET